MIHPDDRWEYSSSNNNNKTRVMAIAVNTDDCRMMNGDSSTGSNFGDADVYYCNQESIHSKEILFSF